MTGARLEVLIWTHAFLATKRWRNQEESLWFVATMMKRRDFLVLSGTAGLAAMTSTTHAAGAGGGGRDFYELRQYILETETQKKGLDDFLKNAAIPALNRLGIKPVGVFYPEKDLSPTYVLLRHRSLESYATWVQRISEDEEFMSRGADLINAPASAPAYKRMESSLMLAFEGMPEIEKPVSNPDRVFQLRTYESPSVKTGLKKIEMFNSAGEIKIFREVGLNPVFFGQTLTGAKMPNLTYMLAFESMDAQKAAWKKFGAHPLWQQLRKMPEYADKAILSGITNLQLVAAPYSQI
jgi:hypothetical protein